MEVGEKSMEQIIDIQHLNKSYGTHEVLRDVNFSVSKGEVVSIIDQDCQGYLLVKNESGEVGWISRDLV